MSLKDSFFFRPTLLVRAPAKPISDFSADGLIEILANADFQNAVFIASPDLHKALSGHNFDFEKLSPALKTSAFKYYNRMSCRPTPFGTFASVGKLNWDARGYELLREAELRELTLAEPNCDEADFGAPDQADLIFLNPSLFSLGSHYRYTARKYNRATGRSVFRIMDVPENRVLSRLVKMLEKPLTYRSALNFLAKLLHPDQAVELLSSLLKAQLLYHSRMPTLTRAEFGKLENPNIKGARGYTVAFHEQRGSLNQSIQSDVLAALEMLEKLTPVVPPSRLTDFAGKFLARFEDQCIPLLTALDPQAGISYLGNELSAGSSGKPANHSSIEANASILKSWTPLNA
ncbi:MAG TPA: lantibiotic dehydratase, partial [Pedobacter sp.]|nr:lantibiotic dehydratase [Pedobacter sp.]